MSQDVRNSRFALLVGDVADPHTLSFAPPLPTDVSRSVRDRIRQGVDPSKVPGRGTTLDDL